MTRKIVAITGASAGVGRATAIAFARRGWHVALLARGSEGLDGARRDVEQAGGVALVLPTDVADHQQVEAAAEHIEQDWGPIDVWINNAMATIFCDFLHISPDDFKRSTEVTYLGAVYGTLAALKRMHPRNHGTIVQVGSALAYRSIPLQSPYCGAKSALRGFTDSLRSELIHDRSHVHITMVHLSAFNTPQFEWGRTCMTKRPRPMGKIFQPEVAAEGIYYAALHRRRELWVGYPAVQAILGQRVIPGALDRYLAHTAVDGQHTDEPLPPDRRDNLYEPVVGDHGAHGRFDAQAAVSSAQLWADTHRWLVGAAALAMLALGALMKRRLV
jgi:NAD(P)-dependent dehydrogenase (short-subunit alcohol dehydrogenase family)